MTLHDAIYEILKICGKPMTYQEIADENASRKLYVKREGTLPLAKQISARVNNYPELFVKNRGSRVALRHWEPEN